MWLQYKSYFLLDGELMPVGNSKLVKLGSRLRAERLRRNEPQRVFAARVGISIPTLRKMEPGDPTILVGYWAAALEILDRVEELDRLLGEPEDLFEKYDRIHAPTRLRASKR
jgi:transcriptional regulator with XRE-family HTH domain